MKKNIGLQARILFFFSVFILILCAALTFLSVTKSLETALEIFASQGSVYARNAAAIIDGDKFEALSKSLDGKDPFYEKTRLELLKMRNEASVPYLYTIAPGGKTNYRYIIDGSGEMGSDDFSYLGDEVNPDDYGLDFHKAWETKTVQHGPLEKTDWGYLVSVYQPSKDQRAGY